MARGLRRDMTQAEAILWEHLRDRRLAGFKFRRQQIIEGFVADFFCNYAKLNVEVDGGVHDTPKQKLIDAHRRKVFADRGLKEIRFRNEEVLGNIENVLLRIEAEADRSV